MKIVNIIGGLGNQMFQYAMYLALKEAHPDEKVFLCRRSYKGYPLHNGYELDCIFGIEAPEASLMQLAKVAYPFYNYKTWQLMRLFPPRKSMTLGTTQIAFNYGEITRDDDVFYDGYWQNENNFLPIRSKLLAAYSFTKPNDDNNLALINKLYNMRAVSCHIRRGDYLKDPVMSVCSKEYYKSAISYIGKKAAPEIYVIFSDDIQWCRENIGMLLKDKDVVFVDWNKGLESYRDIQLMSLCHYNIIANSSFSWWGAWLNNQYDKIVIAPERWMNKPLVNAPICDSWIRISN